MSNTVYSRATHLGKNIQVESAVRDGSGRKIETNYVRTVNNLKPVDGDVLVDISGKEDKSSRVILISSDSDDTHYPSAKAVEDRIVRLKNYIDYQYGPHTVWEVAQSSDGITYSSGRARELSGSDWKLQNLNLTGYKFLLCYIRGCNGDVRDQEGSSLTIRVDLDERSATTRLGYYCGTQLGYAINDNGVKAGAIIVVDSTKTKLAMIYSNFNTTGTTALERDYRLYKVEGFYEDSTFDERLIGGISRADIINALGFTPYSDANPAGYTANIGTISSVVMNGEIKSETGGSLDLGTILTAHQDLSEYAALSDIALKQDIISVRGMLSCDGNGHIVSAEPDMSDYYTRTQADCRYQPSGYYLSSSEFAYDDIILSEED